jgi:hypothetical protein
MISVLNKSAGFFSQFFFTINHYIYCKKRQIDFSLDSTEWTFSYKDGWTDYFKPIELRFGNECIPPVDGRYGHGTVLENVAYSEYGKVLREVYQYNDFIQSKIHEKRAELQLENYNSIFIRRGDKLLVESIFIETEKYIEKMLEKDPDCKTIFLQTDDYNCFLDIQAYLNEKGLDIRLITLCPENLFGFTMSGNEFYNTSSNFQENQHYIDKIRDMNVKNKIIFDLDKDSMLDHMVTFLVGLDIVLQSKICVTDYSSNVARFIKLWKGDNVYTAFNGASQYHEAGKELDVDMVKCPSY